MTATGDIGRVVGAMRSGEWLRTQWIARAAFCLGTAPWEPCHAHRVLPLLRHLEAQGVLEKRDASETRKGDVLGAGVRFQIPRREWRLVEGLLFGGGE